MPRIVLRCHYHRAIMSYMLSFNGICLLFRHSLSTNSLPKTTISPTTIGECVTALNANAGGTGYA
ncbi:MAG: hypothetical protein IPN94_16095 [Sphingobacteriales bacterium]|nr:hypothetical protein [Sphingobacteriales bacterium]